MTREVDWLWLGVEIHHEGDDGRGQVAADVVRDVALPIVAIDLGNAIHVGFVVLDVVVTGREWRATDSLLHLKRDSILVILQCMFLVVAHVFNRKQLLLPKAADAYVLVVHAHLDPEREVEIRLRSHTYESKYLQRDLLRHVVTEHVTEVRAVENTHLPSITQILEHFADRLLQGREPQFKHLGLTGSNGDDFAVVRVPVLCWRRRVVRIQSLANFRARKHAGVVTLPCEKPPNLVRDIAMHEVTTSHAQTFYRIRRDRPYKWQASRRPPVASDPRVRELRIRKNRFPKCVPDVVLPITNEHKAYTYQGLQT